MFHSLKLLEKIQYYYLDGRISGCGAYLPSKSTSKIHLHVKQSSLKWVMKQLKQLETGRTTAVQPRL